MNKRTTMRKWIAAISLMILGGGMSGCAGGTSWKEEVLLHDGNKLIVERSQTYGGRHEIGQKPPVKEQKLTFTLPGATRSITWKSEYSEDIGRANLNLLALHVLNGTPYIVAEPNLCLAYNKWGRPNPPYVFFKYDGKAWKRIPQPEFPVEFKSINVVINTKRHADEISKQGVASVADVKEFNSSLLRYPSEHPAYKTILREPLKPGSVGLCPPELTGFKAPYPIPPKPGNTGGK
jgi:hypothetical protein